MTTFKQVREQLRDQYVALGYPLIEENDKNLVFGTSKSSRAKFEVTEEEIKSVVKTLVAVNTMSLGPRETIAISPDSFEQVLASSSERRGIIVSPRLVYQFGGDDSTGITVYIGPASEDYKNFFRANKLAAAALTERGVKLSVLQKFSLGAYLDRIMTIRLVGIKELVDEKDYEAIADYCNNCLFELSYLKGQHLGIKESWSENLNRERLFSTRMHSPARKFPFKDVKYTGALTRFYRRAMSSDDPYIQFISFYHILEFFFVQITDDILYEKIKRIANDPAFRPRRPFMDKIIKSVDDHKRTSDEGEMLKNVITHYCEEDEVIDFIQKYESAFSKTYTEQQQCFGQTLEKITLKQSHVLGPVAKRIKTIRNTLVHSSDRYERTDRYVPGADANQILKRELSLMRFIAEKVIIGSASKE